MHALELHASSEADMETLGARLAVNLGSVRLIYTHGPLGAGKTTLVRGLLRELGFGGAVKSPTFALVESYEFPELMLYHFDLYRLKDPEELEFIGIRDYLSARAGPSVCIVEWAEKAEGLLPPPDIDVMIQPVNTGRSVRLVAHSEHGAALLGGLSGMVSPERHSLQEEE